VKAIAIIYSRGVLQQPGVRKLGNGVSLLSSLQPAVDTCPWQWLFINYSFPRKVSKNMARRRASYFGVSRVPRATLYSWSARYRNRAYCSPYLNRQARGLLCFQISVTFIERTTAPEGLEYLNKLCCYAFCQV
jgi:hypothetical protein